METKGKRLFIPLLPVLGWVGLQLSPLESSWIITLLLWGFGIGLAVWIYSEDIKRWVATQPLASGLAVAVVVLLVVLVLVISADDQKSRGGYDPTVPGPDPTVSEPIGPATDLEPPKVYIEEDAPEDVYKTIGALPPHEIGSYYQRAYVGKWARWEGTVSGVTRVGDERIMVSIYRQPEDHVLDFPVSLSFSVADASSLESLRVGDFIRYEGKIYGEYEWPPLISLAKPRIIRVLGRTTPWPPAEFPGLQQ